MKVPVRLNAYYEMARRLYQTGPSHDFSHMSESLTFVRIGSREGADLRILGLAALLHDLAREEESMASGGEVCHAAASAVQARKILTEQAEDVSSVSQVAEVHRFPSFSGPEPTPGRWRGNASMVPDKLDSLGAVGIARAYLWLGEHGGVVYEHHSGWRTHNRGE